MRPVEIDCTGTESGIICILLVACRDLVHFRSTDTHKYDMMTGWEEVRHPEDAVESQNE